MPVLVQGAGYLKEGIEFAKSIQAIGNFFQGIRDLIEKKREDVDSDLRQGPWRSVQAMVKVAAKNGCDLQILHSNRDGKTLEVRLSSADAVNIQERARVATAKAIRAGRED